MLSPADLQSTPCWFSLRCLMHQDHGGHCLFLSKAGCMDWLVYHRHILPAREERKLQASVPDRSCHGVADADNSDGYMPLHCAAIGGHAGCVDALLAAKADNAAVSLNDRCANVPGVPMVFAVSLPVAPPPPPLPSTGMGSHEGWMDVSCKAWTCVQRPGYSTSDVGLLHMKLRPRV